MRITKKKTPFHSDLQINNHTLEEAFEFSDLGLITSSKLSWNAHVDKITSKVNKILGLVKRTCKGMKDITTLRTLFCALVRSQLEYCTVVWSPQTARNINKLEKIQRRATTFILKTDDDHDTRRKQLNLLSLEDRRFLFDVLFLYKVLNGYISIYIYPHIFNFILILMVTTPGEGMNLDSRRTSLQLPLSKAVSLIGSRTCGMYYH